MSGAHTPGPWIQMGKNVGVTDGEIASVWDIDGCQYENAQLIAAAPDLLAALRRAVLALAFASETFPAMRDDYEAVSAAIAKATGAAS